MTQVWPFGMLQTQNHVDWSRVGIRPGSGQSEHSIPKAKPTGSGVANGHQPRASIGTFRKVSSLFDGVSRTLGYAVASLFPWPEPPGKEATAMIPNDYL